MSAPAGLFFYGERCTVPDMPVWKLEPINPDDEHWTASRYVGPLFVRAADDDGARELAAMACGIGKGKLSSGMVSTTAWRDALLANCTQVEDSEYNEEGADAILGPEKALSRAFPLLS